MVIGRALGAVLRLCPCLSANGATDVTGNDNHVVVLAGLLIIILERGRMIDAGVDGGA